MKTIFLSTVLVLASALGTSASLAQEMSCNAHFSTTSQVTYKITVPHDDPAAEMAAPASKPDL